MKKKSILTTLLVLSAIQFIINGFFVNSSTMGKWMPILIGSLAIISMCITSKKTLEEKFA